MKIINVGKDNIISFVSIPRENEDSQKAFVKENENMILTDYKFERGKRYLYIDNKIVEDKIFNNLKSKKMIKSKINKILSDTDFIILADNPLDLDEESINKVIEFRKNLRIAKKTLDIPEIPDFLKEFVNLSEF